MSSITLAQTIEAPLFGASSSWSAFESLAVQMSRELPSRALASAGRCAVAVDRLCLLSPVGGAWPAAPFGARGAGRGRTSPARGGGPRPRKLHTSAGPVELILWHVGCRSCGRNLVPLLIMLGLSSKRRTDRLGVDLAELGTQMSLFNGAPHHRRVESSQSLPSTRAANPGVHERSHGPIAL